MEFKFKEVGLGDLRILHNVLIYLFFPQPVHLLRSSLVFFKAFVLQLYNLKCLLDLAYKFQRIMTFVNASDRGHVVTAARLCAAICVTFKVHDQANCPPSL